MKEQLHNQDAIDTYKTGKSNKITNRFKVPQKKKPTDNIKTISPIKKKL